MSRLLCYLSAVAGFLAASTSGLIAGVTLRPAAPPQGQSPVTIYSFPSVATGSFPVGGLVDIAGSLYGTTNQGGGACGCGTIYAVGETTAPGRLVGYRKVVNFKGGAADGSSPTAGLVAVEDEQKKVMLYGTTVFGGEYANGTVFACGLSGDEHPIKQFPKPRIQDGEQPYAGLAASGSELYGTTALGGTDEGVAFELRTDGSTYDILTNFSGKYGVVPKAGLLGLSIDGSSRLYGTTTGGGTGGGTVFELGKGGAVVWSYPFAGPPDGKNPQAALIYLNGLLYGTTASGGKYNAGSVFRIPITGGKPTILHSFTTVDGAQPMAALFYDSGNGYLYGTTYSGSSVLYGTVFKMSPTGTNFSILHYFYGPTQKDKTDGENPAGNLILVNGLLYGTTEHGGAALLGTVFAVKP